MNCTTTLDEVSIKLESGDTLMFASFAAKETTSCCDTLDWKDTKRLRARSSLRWSKK